MPPPVLLLGDTFSGTGMPIVSWSKVLLAHEGPRSWRCAGWRSGGSSRFSHVSTCIAMLSIQGGDTTFSLNPAAEPRLAYDLRWTHNRR